MSRVTVSLLRGNCQIPCYVAHETGLFRRHGLEVEPNIVATAWQIPDRLASGQADFAILPWTRAVLGNLEGNRLVVVCGSGREEAAIVVRNGVRVDEVRSVALPKRGGLKDLTAMALMESLGWTQVREIRQPSGDAAILALIGGAADAASMIEPFATMLEERGIGTVVRRTGDVFPGAPGCSLTTTARHVAERRDVVQAFVDAFRAGAEIVLRDPVRAAGIAADHIGVAAEILQKALAKNRPDPDALCDRRPIDAMLGWMKRLGYIDRVPDGWMDSSFFEPNVGGPEAGETRAK